MLIGRHMRAGQKVEKLAFVHRIRAKEVSRDRLPEADASPGMARSAQNLEDPVAKLDGISFPNKICCRRGLCLPTLTSKIRPGRFNKIFILDQRVGVSIGPGRPGQKLRLGGMDQPFRELERAPNMVVMRMA